VERGLAAVKRWFRASLLSLALVLCVFVFVGVVTRRFPPSLRRLLLLIPVGHNSELQRRDIRSAWSLLSIPRHWTIDRRFLVCDGELLRESDLIQLPCDESYEGLSAKVFTMMSWAAELEFDVAVKVDADVFVNPTRLLAELDKVVTSKELSESWWWGFVHVNMRVNRDAVETSGAPRGAGV
jgi:hypothetical protein